MTGINSEMQNIIELLKLEPHPEGGFYKETYRSDEIVQSYRGERSTGTGIYFLLPQQVCTSWHRVTSDELWHFYKGDQLILEIIDGNGSFHRNYLHDNLKGDMVFQELVPQGCWQRAYSTGRYSLCGCTVSPGFEFEDFEMIKTDELATQFPGIASQITYKPFG